MKLKFIDWSVEDKENKSIIKSNDELIFPIELKKVKKFKNIQKKFKKFIIDIIAILYLIIGRFLYILSLKGCNKSEFDCLHDLNLIKEGINNCIKSTFYFIFTLFLIHMKICSLFIIIIFIIIYIELIIRDHGENFLHHGKLNLFGLLTLTIIGEIVILFVLLNKFLIQKKKYFLISFIALFFLIISIIITIKNKDEYYCKDWDKGLNNTYINNDPSLYPCKINIPNEKCFISILGSLLDFSKILNIKCEKRTSN